MAVNASTGAQLWAYSWGFGSGSTAPVANGVVYSGSDLNDAFYAIDAGTVLWTFQAGQDREYAFTTDPAVAGGLVYASAHGILYALDASTGALVWDYPSAGPTAVTDGVVYASTYGAGLYALNASTGALLWNSSISSGDHVAVAAGVVYVGSWNNDLYAVNASTGAVLWSYATGGSVETRPAIANGVVYVGSDDGKVYAFGLTGGGSANPAAVSVSPSSAPPSRNVAPPRSYVPSPANNVPSTASFDQAPAASSSIGFAQVAAAIAHSTKASVPYSNAQTAGDLNVVVVGWNDAVATISSVTDTKGNTYSLAIGPTRGTALANRSTMRKTSLALRLGRIP